MRPHRRTAAFALGASLAANGAVLFLFFATARAPFPERMEVSAPVLIRLAPPSRSALLPKPPSRAAYPTPRTRSPPASPVEAPIAAPPSGGEATSPAPPPPSASRPSASPPGSDADNRVQRALQGLLRCGGGGGGVQDPDAR
ncbi:MAG: hypothetical protein WA840_14960, partial [Caulobacteraceae bacterium]